MGAALLELGRSADSLDHFRQCLQLRKSLFDKSPQDVSMQINLMLADARTGEHASASQRASEIAEKNPQNAGRLYQAACCYSLCVPAVAMGKPEQELTDDEGRLRADYAARSIQAIRQAVLHDYKDVVALETDPDLTPVRQEAEFQKILEERRSR
jgi:hypothetical protein